MTTNDMLTIDQAMEESGLKRATLYRELHNRNLNTYRRPGDRKSYVRRQDLVELTGFRPSKKRVRTRDRSKSTFGS